MSKAIDDVIAERNRQIEVEGWTSEHDDTEHQEGDLAFAAACYAIHAGMHDGRSSGDLYCLKNIISTLWSWSFEWFKPKHERRDLIRAAALIIAEIDKLDRKEAKL